MKNISVLLFLSLALLLNHQANAQEQNNGGGQLSGNLEANANFFMRDSLIGAANTPQYDRQLYGADAWLNLSYSNWGFDFGLRFDLFNNSNLLNPTSSYTDEGIGRWYIHKKIEKLDISVGYLYDQVGSGIIFRAFEERPLLIDNALLGARLAYEFLPDWQIKAFTGRQKQQFDLYGSVIKGAAVDGFLSGGEGASWSIAPGFGVVNRTLDDASMNSLVATINTYSKDDAFVPKYNTYAFSLYNTLTAGNFTWYVEGAYKTEDNLNDPFGTFNLGDTAQLQSLFTEAGIPNTEITTIEGTARFASIEAWVTTDVKGWTLADMIDDDQFHQLLTEAEKELQPFVISDGSVAFSSPAHIVTAIC